MRNKIALGEIRKYGTAAKMSAVVSAPNFNIFSVFFFGIISVFYLLAMEWRNGELNVRSCIYSKDECRATSMFAYNIWSVRNYFRNFFSAQISTGMLGKTLPDVAFLRRIMSQRCMPSQQWLWTGSCNIETQICHILIHFIIIHLGKLYNMFGFMEIWEIYYLFTQNYITENTSVILQQWLMTKTMQLVVQWWNWQKMISSIVIWCVIMAIQMLWVNKCTSGEHQLRNAETDIRYMMAFAQRIQQAIEDIQIRRKCTFRCCFKHWFK